MSPSPPGLLGQITNKSWRTSGHTVHLSCTNVHKSNINISAAAKNKTKTRLTFCTVHGVQYNSGAWEKLENCLEICVCGEKKVDYGPLHSVCVRIGSGVNNVNVNL